jgi:hypothetical protein
MILIIWLWLIFGITLALSEGFKAEKNMQEIFKLILVVLVLSFSGGATANEIEQDKKILNGAGELAGVTGESSTPKFENSTSIDGEEEPGFIETIKAIAPFAPWVSAFVSVIATVLVIKNSRLKSKNKELENILKNRLIVKAITHNILVVGPRFAGKSTSVRNFSNPAQYKDPLHPTNIFDRFESHIYKNETHRQRESKDTGLINYFQDSIYLNFYDFGGELSLRGPAFKKVNETGEPTLLVFFFKSVDEGQISRKKANNDYYNGDFFNILNEYVVELKEKSGSFLSVHVVFSKMDLLDIDDEEVTLKSLASENEDIISNIRKIFSGGNLQFSLISGESGQNHMTLWGDISGRAIKHYHQNDKYSNLI